MLVETFPISQGSILKFWTIVSRFNKSSEEIYICRSQIY